MKFVTVARTTDLNPGAMKAVDIEDHELLLANVDNKYYAMMRKCSHMAENLCYGSLTGNVITCPRHGARFDVTTGKAVGKAKLLFLATTPKDLATYPVKIEGDDILIGVS